VKKHKNNFFYFIVLLLLVCFSVFPFPLSTSSRCGMRLQIFCASLMLPPPTCVLSASQTITFGDSLTTFPCHFFVALPWNLQLQKPMLMCKAEPNALCVVGHLARCSSNNIVNNSEQEAPSEVDIDDLIIQEAFLDSLKKQAKFWRPR
jgi:hypothetical protein